MSYRVRACCPWVLLLLSAGCKSSTEPPDPSAFKAFEERPQTDPRAVVFSNQSVEMAALEIFAPRVTQKDCHAEAPHRLLCPSDYRHILDKQVFPRTQVVVTYPKELSLDCGQIWVRVHSRVMAQDEFREAIFLLGDKDKGLSLQLGEGAAARLDPKDIETKNQYPPPIRYCPLDGAGDEVPVRTRSELEIGLVLKQSGDKLDACCTKEAPCRGQLKASLAIQRDGKVQRAELVESKGQIPGECLAKALGELTFGGFTAKPTVAEVNLRLPRAR